MSEPAPSQPSELRARLGIVGGLVASIAVLSVIWQAVSHADTPKFEPQVAAVVKDKKLVVAVALPKEHINDITGSLSVELTGSGPDTLMRASQAIRDTDTQGPYRFEFEVEPARAKKMRLRVGLQEREAQTSVAKVLLAKPHETTLSAGQDFHAGSPASLVCGVFGVKSVAESIPLAGSDVTVRLKGKDGKTHELFAGKTGTNGLADAQLKVPELPAGEYTLVVATKSAFGEETLERPVRVTSDSKVLLVSDKPIYQPGQLMHLRALALRPFDMKPVGDRDLVFEVEDPKGNKVFKRTLKTSEFGIAAIDFQLADEVNMGDYLVRAILGETKAEKTVQVKRYVLPKFKVEVKADKTFYLPKETVKLDLQSDYFFGKPVSGAKVEVTASTFDVAFRKFHTWKGETDAAGHAKLEVKLPDYFVGQPLQQGNALVKFDVKLLDSADHSETVGKSYTVSDQPIRVSLIPEGGRIVPEMENRIFVAALYPDGTPAPNCDVTLWHKKPAQAAPQGGPPGGRPGRIAPAAIPEGPAGAPQPPPARDVKEAPKQKPLATAKTNAAGLAEFKIKPTADMLRTGEHGPRDVEMLGGKQQVFGPRVLLDLVAGARDAKGNTALVGTELNSHPMGENVLLRLDKAVYQTGDRMNVDVRTSAGMPTVFVDVVRGGQIMLSRWLDVKEGAASHVLDLPQTVFGSLEVHAYQMLQHGEIIRDSRVVYVQPRGDLKVSVKAGQDVFEPGENGRIRFQVTDAAGKPTPAALGVIIVDEAVYALQDLQPGLEKVYFTLQEELLKPQVQIKFSETVDNIVLQPVVPAPRQQVAEVLLTSVKLPPPRRLLIDPAQERRQRVEQQVQQIGGALFQYAWDQAKDPIVFDKKSRRWAFRDGLLEEVVKTGMLNQAALVGVFGDKLTLDDLGRIEKDFTPAGLAKAITAQRIHQTMWNVVHYTNQNRNKFAVKDRWVLPPTILQDAAKAMGMEKRFLTDAWGRPLHLVHLDYKGDNPLGQPQFERADVRSAGPDGKLGNKDDIGAASTTLLARFGWAGGIWWDMDALRDGGGVARNLQWGARDQLMRRRLGAVEERMEMAAGAVPKAAFGGPGAGAPPLAIPADAAAVRNVATAPVVQTQGGAKGGGEAPVTRVREYFPETMLWQPAMITDDKGVADLAVNFADSITTWRLSASANSKAGALGNATVPLKVFQDFFVDIDLPVSLTQGDEVAFPVAVYNYLKTPQTVRIELQAEPWFELLDAGGLTRKLDLKPNEVTAVKFRIKAGKIGMQPLMVKAFGSKKSDAVKRVVEVVPNGQRFEKVVSDRLKGNIAQDIDLPANAIPDASKLFVRIYPGVMAQVLEGVDGMIRLPGG